MKESLFDVLRDEGLNRIRIHYDWHTDRAVLYTAREWEDDMAWREYNRRFTIYSVLTDNAVYHNDRESRALFEKHGLSDYLERVIGLMRKGRHQRFEGFYWKKKDIRFMNHIHSVNLGIHNRSQTVVMGGIRRHEPHEDEFDVIVDGMNLGRGMSFKNVAAHVPCGGCKITVHAAQVDLDDLDEVGFLAYANDCTRNTTGPDMNYPAELADVVRAHFSFGFAGGVRGFLGTTGRPTAWGTYHAMKQAVAFLEGSDSLAGKRIAVQGLGSVGSHLAEYYLQEGASLLVTDMLPQAVEAFQKTHAGGSVEVVSPEEIYFVDADLFSPCAHGGILTEDRIARMGFRVIAGPANNQLRASSQEEEYTMARRLSDAGILFVLDWWQNIGGVMTGWEEYVHQGKADMGALMDRIERICRDETWRLLEEARKAGVTPTEMAYRMVEETIYGEKP